MAQVNEELEDLVQGRGGYACKFVGDGIRLFLEGHVVVPRSEPADGEIIEEATPNGITVKAGSGPESVYEFIHVNPNWLRNKALNLLNVADYIENRDAIVAAKEAEANAARDKRRDELANQFAPRTLDRDPNWYMNVSPGLRNAIDHIIATEDAAK